MAHQCLLTSRFVAPSIPWGVSAPGGKMRKQLLKDHNFLNNSPIFIIESYTFNILLVNKHCIQYISIWKIVLDLVKGTWHHNFMAGCGSLLWANTCSLWSGIKSWPGPGCLQRLVRRTSLPYLYFWRHEFGRTLYDMPKFLFFFNKKYDGILHVVNLLSTWPLGTNFSEILFEIQIFSLKKIHL